MSTPPEPRSDTRQSPRVPRGPILLACSVLAFLTLTFAVIAHFARESVPPDPKTTAP